MKISIGTSEISSIVFNRYSPKFSAFIKYLWIAEPSNTPVLGSLCVMPNPFVPGSMLVLAASGGVLSTYQSSGREELQALDFFPIRDIRRVHGMGLDKVCTEYETWLKALQTASPRLHASFIEMHNSYRHNSLSIRQ